MVTFYRFQGNGTMKEEAIAYLNEVLDYIQEKSVRRQHIDWQALRQEASALAASAQTKAETYPAIERALGLLGDHHSMFFDPERAQLQWKGKARHFGFRAIYPEGTIALVFPGSPADQAGLQVGDRIEMINGQPLTAMTIEQFHRLTILNNTPPDLMLILKSRDQEIARSVHLQAASYVSRTKYQARRLEHNIGYLDLPGSGGNAQAQRTYATKLQQSIRDLDQTAICGWVIDLRREIGGGCWHLWAGIGPILGEGAFCSFVGHSEIVTMFYRAGKVFADKWNHHVEADEPYELKQPWPPVAVLTSQLTASAGEFVALAFRGRPRARSFGEPTHGVPTGNHIKELSDGAFIALTSSLGANRTGQTYESSLLPDQYVKVDWMQLGTVADPVLEAAIQWLRAQGCCL